MNIPFHEWEDPFCVVTSNVIQITGFHEKPMSLSYINAGVYALSPAFLNSLALDEHCDIAALFERAMLSGLQTIAYPMHEPWLDGGR